MKNYVIAILALILVMAAHELDYKQEVIEENERQMMMVEAKLDYCYEQKIVE